MLMINGIADIIEGAVDFIDYILSDTVDFIYKLI